MENPPLIEMKLTPLFLYRDLTGITIWHKVRRGSGSTTRLLGGLKAAARKPTNLARVGDVQQGPTESPAAYLERLMEVFTQYTPMDPEAEGTQAALIMHFVNQAAPDIRKKLQKPEHLGEKSIQDLITVAERVYNTRETPEEKQAKAADHQTHNMACILLVATVPDSGEREHQLRRLAAEGKSCPRT